MKLDTYIKKYGSYDLLWYIDVKGEDQKGREVWISGNVLSQRQCGYGGFYSYEEAKNIIDHFEDLVNYKPEDFRNASDDGVTEFTPQVLYLGFSPLDIKKDNQVWPIRRVL